MKPSIPLNSFVADSHAPCTPSVLDGQPPPAYDSLSIANVPFTLSTPHPAVLSRFSDSIELNHDERLPPSPYSSQQRDQRPNVGGLALPSVFSRPTSLGISYTPFSPTYLTANGRHLDRGFPMMVPPPLVQPHPFASHDVNEADWKQRVIPTIRIR